MGDRRGTSRRWLRLALLFAVTGLLVALHQSWLRIPANLAPWGEVALDQPPSLLARLQINSLAADPAACMAALDRSELVYRRTPARRIVGGCGLAAVVHPLQSHIPYNRSFDVTCGMMAALYWYEARLQDLAQQHLGSAITRIDQLGTYACRNINNATSGRRSQHATANAIDIAAFHLADGRTVSVARDWGKDTPQGRFLAEARDEACSFFNVVLSPNYNALHADHLHLDLGGFRICR
ncbi:MAG TPA: extensin family protein [Dongiaceae bacterium]|jgi:hypothetical protein|nr:extensin family protein [Dongiaceae bacterium]